MIKDRENPKMTGKYVTPFSEMIKGMINSSKSEKLSSREWDEAVVELAYRRLNIKECCECHYPLVDGWRCSFCGNGDT